MKVSGSSIPIFGRASRRASCLALLTLGVGATASLGAPAAASATQHPEYSLSIVEGVSTLPEDQITHTSGSVEPQAPVVLSIIHNGLVVARDSESRGNAWLSQVPQVGDEVALESPAGVTVASVVYDGLPSMDPTVCASSINFSGQRTGGQKVEGGAYTLVPHPSYTARRFAGEAQVTVLSGSSYAGYFLAPLAFGETVWARESSENVLAGGAVFSFSSENDRPVGACPPPPAPPPPPPPPVLQGRIAKIAAASIRKLLKSGLLNQVTINQPGRIVEDLYLKGGSVPAFAARKSPRHKRKPPPPAVLLARGTAIAGSAGTFPVILTVTRQGRRVLKHATHVRAVLVVTLYSNAGAKLTVERRSVLFHR